MRPVIRIAVVVVLLAALLGLCVHHGTAYDEGWPHPTGEQLEDDYDAFVGDRVLLFAEVQSVDAERGTMIVHVTTDADEVAAELEIHDGDASVAPGAVVQIYGVLESDRTMTPAKTVVVNRDRTAVPYKLAASALGIALAAGFFLRHWRPNLDRFTVEPRGTAAESNDDEVSERG